MAAKKQTLKATLPDGRVVTRKTARDYTHVVARMITSRPVYEDGWCALTWTTQPMKAEQRMLRDFPVGQVDSDGQTWGASQLVPVEKV